MNSFIKLSVVTGDPAEKDLIIGMLSEAGYDGFEEEHRAVHAYIRADLFDETTALNILQPQGLSFSHELIPETNWNNEWEKSFQPVLINEFCYIRASFHPAKENVKYDIIITPRMSFGTGHHATTYLMIQQMERLDFVGKRILDFGTGTGVLAILAEKMGAREIFAIDNDKWSIENTGENILENNCSKIRIREAGEIDFSFQFNVILANINRNVLLNQMAGLAQHLKNEGVLIISGLLSGDRLKIEAVANEAGLMIREAEEREGWIVLNLIFN